jgi:hypothetical protein
MAAGVEDSAALILIREPYIGCLGFRKELILAFRRHLMNRRLPPYTISTLGSLCQKIK